jgi:hypothetical protein
MLNDFIGDFNETDQLFLNISSLFMLPFLWLDDQARILISLSFLLFFVKIFRVDSCSFEFYSKLLKIGNKVFVLLAALVREEDGRIAEFVVLVGGVGDCTLTQ